jgi:hypothetical protein
MGRVVLEELQGYRMDLQVGERQVHAEGMPIFNGSGEPKMEPIWVFSYSAPQPDGGMHTVISPPISDEGRQKLIEALTGGVVLARTMPVV